MANSLKILARKLTEFIESKKISKSDLSRKSGISRTNLDLYLKEQAVPRLDALDKIAEALDIKPKDLIDEGIDPLAEKLSDPLIRRAVSVLSSVDDHQRLVFVRQMEMVTDMLLEQRTLQDKKQAK